MQFLMWSYRDIKQHCEHHIITSIVISDVISRDVHLIVRVTDDSRGGGLSLTHPVFVP